jgi:RHS repeat-associated protein
LGNPYRTAQDLDGDQQIGLSGVDRVQESETQHVQRSGGIWQETAQRVYATESAGTATTVSTQRSRLSGFAGGAIAEAESVDVYGNVTSSRTLLNASGATVTQLVSVPDSAIPQLTISVQGRVISTTSSTGLTTAFMYDGFGRRTGVMDGRTGTSTTHYDAAGRVDYVEDAAQHRTSFAYELSTGRKIGEINALGKVTRMAYTQRGELWRTWGDVPYPVEYGYDAQGRRATMRTYRQALPWNDTSWPLAATGDVTTWEYDAASGLLSAKRDAAGQAVQYTYEAGGRLKTRRWARTVSGSPLVTTYNYQPGSGDLAQVDYSDTTPDVTFAYDRLGRAKQVTDGSGVHTLAYDASSLALGSETRTGLVPATLTYKRSSSGVLGRSTGVQLGSGYDVTYGYDAQGRVGSVGWSVSGQSDSATYTRVAGSELLGGVTYASGLATTYGYEATRDLKTQVKNVAGGVTVSQYDYQYDAVGRRGSVVNSGSAFAMPAYSRWSYNDRNELIESARYEGANVGDVSQPVMGEYRAYGFDAIGNRTGASEAGTMKSYATNALNEYTSAAGATLTYDVDGNLTNDGARKFTYDAENRLTVVEPVTLGNGAVRVRMVYDYLGRRVLKVVEEHDGSAWSQQDDVRFVYVGWNVVEERHTTSGGDTKKSFVWGLDLSQSLGGAGGIGGLLAAVDEQGSQMAFLCDANGNVGQLVDELGSTVAKYEYDAFGKMLVESGTAARENPYRFSTKYFEQETGLMYYGFRFYSPTMGRWISRDPVGEAGSIALYGFVGGDPISGIDILGMFDFRGFVNGAWDFLTEPIMIASDLSVMSMVLGYNEVFGGGITEEMTFMSMLGRSQAARVGAGQGTLESAVKGAGEMVGNIVSLGAYGTIKNIYENVSAYSSDEITLEQLDYNLSHGAGGQVMATVTAAGVSRSTGSGWFGESAPNPVQEQQMINNLIGARIAGGKSRFGNATFAQVAEEGGQTAVYESADYQTTFRHGHAEAQGLAASGGRGARTVAVDQKPCGVCRLRLQAASIRGAVRVVIPANPELATQGPKTVAIKGALGKVSPAPGTQQVIGFKVILVCDQDETRLP